MIYPDNFEAITGYSQIREMLSAFCRFDSSRFIAENHHFLTAESEIRQMFDETDEYNQLIAIQPGITDLGQSSDMSRFIPSLGIENFFLDEESLFSIRLNAEVFQKYTAYLGKKKEEFPELNRICGDIPEIQAVVKIIQSVIDTKAKLLPYASAQYGKINHEIEKLEKDARQLVRGIFRQWRDSGYTAETDITVREERLVIPVQAEHKRHVRGLVKDVSSTGRIIYIEPIESLELNNRLKELYAESRREREKILRETSAKLRPHTPALNAIMQALTAFDWIAARCSLAKKLQAERPALKNQPGIALKQAVNPLLKLRNHSQKKETVPMSVTLNKEDRVMVISGPNAGGKSITLKTVLLLQYMAQCGMFITALPESECGIFTHISVDCGDGQSIDEGLSTFSAHLEHLKKMTTLASPGSLFGIDELGDGTDPRFGGPIAQAVLEDFLNSGAMGVVTTHYSRLKEWAGRTPHVINASMLYDTRELKPMYQLVTGKPGSSFALELLKKTGFSAQIIQRVQNLSGEESQKAEELLLDLEEKQRELHELLDENKTKSAQYTHLINEYSQLKTKLETRKKEILDAARGKASLLVNEANKQIELTIRTIREHGAGKEKTLQARKKLREFEEKKINSEDTRKKESKPVKITENTASETLVKKPIKWLAGMQVANKLNGAAGEILEVKKDKILVAFGLLKMWVHYDEIEPIGTHKNVRQRKPVSGYNWIERQAGFSPTLDLRGNHVDDALLKVQKWLDEAYALGQQQLKIIHGRGDGILRKALRTHFKTVNYIRNYRSEQEDSGGDGCTIIDLM